MKVPVFEIKCKRNTDAIIVAKHLEENDIVPDERSGSNVYLSIEALQFENEYVTVGEMKEDILHVIEDACMEYELDYTPEIIETEFDFEEDES